MFPVGAKDVVAVLDLVDHGGQFAALPLFAAAEELADAVGGQAPQSDFATALEDFVDGKIAFEDEIPALYVSPDCNEL